MPRASRMGARTEKEFKLEKLAKALTAKTPRGRLNYLIDAVFEKPKVMTTQEVMADEMAHQIASLALTGKTDRRGFVTYNLPKLLNRLSKSR